MRGKRERVTLGSRLFSAFWWWVAPVVCLLLVAVTPQLLSEGWNALRGQGEPGFFLVESTSCSRHTCTHEGVWTSEDGSTRFRAKIINAKAWAPGFEVPTIQTGPSAAAEPNRSDFSLAAGMALMAWLYLGFWSVMLKRRFWRGTRARARTVVSSTST